MEALSKFKGKDYVEVYFLTGEMVTLFNEGTWWYEDALNPDALSIGTWYKTEQNKVKVQCDGAVPLSVKAALKEEGYSIAE
ncbi:MAG: hypothetical protein IIV77_00015 [Bacteroidaceae bacterium]|nr:hypothetical protein [Bacteroidaceae bacterium]